MRLFKFVSLLATACLILVFAGGGQYPCAPKGNQVTTDSQQTSWSPVRCSGIHGNTFLDSKSALCASVVFQHTY
jgi:hypothetical protein